MRFGGLHGGSPVFPFLPDTVPKELYREVVLCKQVKKNEIVAIEPTKHQLLKAIVSELDPRILDDPNVFPVDVEVLRALASFGEYVDRPIIPVTNKYICIAKDGECFLETYTGFVLARGHPGDLFTYANKFCRPALRTIVHAMRNGYIPSPIKHDNLAAALSWFRKQRQFSKGLDAISKTDELGSIDQENVVNKFMLQCDDVQNDKCLHVGAGSNVSSSQIALFQHYSRVVLVDPRCVVGPDSVCGKFEPKKVQEGWDIVSDVACGDAEGMTLEGQKELLEQLYSFCTGRLVIAKCGLQKGVRIRGFLRRKPRPHNLEIILELDPEGDTLDDIYDREAPKVLKVNELRNLRMYQHRFGGLKQTFTDSYELCDILMRKSKTKLPRAPHVWKSGIDRNVVLFQHAGGRIWGARIVAFLRSMLQGYW